MTRTRSSLSAPCIFCLKDLPILFPLFVPLPPIPTLLFARITPPLLIMSPPGSLLAPKTNQVPIPVIAPLTVVNSPLMGTSPPIRL